MAKTHFKKRWFALAEMGPDRADGRFIDGKRQEIMPELIFAMLPIALPGTTPQCTRNASFPATSPLTLKGSPNRRREPCCGCLAYTQ